MSLKPRRSNHAHPPVRPGIQRRLPSQDDNQPIQGELVSSSFSAEEFNQSDSIMAVRSQPSRAGFWALLIIVSSLAIWGIGMVAGFQTALALQMGLGLLLAAGGLASPSLGLLAIGLLAGVDAIASELLLTGGLLRYNTLNYWLILVALLFIPFILRLRDLSSRALQLFLLLIVLELTFSLDLESGIQDVLNVAATFGMVVYFARSLHDEQALYWLGVVNGFVAGIGGLVLMLQINSLPYANPNNWTFWQLTALFSICISFPYARLLHKSRLLLLVLAMVNVAWIFLSASRGSLLIAFLCLVYLFLSTRSVSWSSVMIGMAALGFLWVSALFVEQQSYTISRLQLLFDPNKSETQRTSQRSELFKAGWEIFQSNPLGIGTGSFRVRSAETSFFAGERPAHSAWMKTLAENGIPGILLLALFVGSYAIIGMKKQQEGKLLFGIFITLVFVAGFVAKEFRGKSLWFLAASGIVLLQPEEMLAYLKEKLKPNDIDYRQRLREIRFGPKQR